MRPPATAPSPTASVGSPASRVMELVRRRGVIKREELARRTGLSTATVARAVSALVEAGLLRYAIDRTSDRGVGRPGTPLQVDTRRFVVVGVHLGRRVATVALGDLSGQVLDTRLSPHRSLMVAELGALVTELLASVPARQPLAAGVVAPWQALGWDRSRVEDEVHDLLGLDVCARSHRVGRSGFHRGSCGVARITENADPSGQQHAVRCGHSGQRRLRGSSGPSRQGPVGTRTAARHCERLNYSSSGRETPRSAARRLLEQGSGVSPRCLGGAAGSPLRQRPR